MALSLLRTLVLPAALLLVAGAAGPVMADGKETAFTVRYDGPPELRAVDVGENEVVSGRVSGIVGDAAEAGPLAGAAVDCSFVGRTFEGRSFSCGFTTVEDVDSLCVFTDADGDQAIADLSCRTAATMTSDARCEGEATWIDGTGKYAGVSGEAHVHSELFRSGEAGDAVWSGEMDLPMTMLGFRS